MAIPKLPELRKPVLRSLRSGKALSIQEIVATVAKDLGLTDEEVSSTNANSGKPILYGRISSALSSLQTAKFVERPSRGIYKITNLGLSYSDNTPEKINFFVNLRVSIRRDDALLNEKRVAAKAVSGSDPALNRQLFNYTDLDFEFAAGEYSKGFNYVFPLKIFALPAALDAKNSKVVKGFDIQSADERELVFFQKPSHDGLKFWAMMILPFLIIFITGGVMDWLLLCFMAIPVIGFFYSLSYLVAHKVETITFNRMKGTVTYPKFAKWGYSTLNFEKCVFRIVYSVGGPGGAFKGYSLEFFDESDPSRDCMLGDVEKTYSADRWGMLRTISFLVWYMDRNRPLPPGSLFDDYREKDRLRYEADGKQPPLYGVDNITEDIIDMKLEY